jgi:hypothetical protein
MFAPMSAVMSKSRIILVATGLLAVVLMLVWRVGTRRNLRTDSAQPSGKVITNGENQTTPASAYTQLTNWLPFIPLTDETPTCAKAEQCVRDLGTNAIPALIVLLRQQDTNFLRPGAMTRSQGLASFGFGTLGSVAAPAVSSLVECMDDERPEVRAVAATCLREIGEPASNAVPRLVTALNDPSPDVRLCAVLALAIVRGDGKLVVPGLVSFLQGAHPEGDYGDWGQIAAIAALGHYDAVQTAQAIPVLRRMTNATSSIVQSRVRFLLWQLEHPERPDPRDRSLYRATGS